jgi:hypothetical protein
MSISLGFARNFGVVGNMAVSNVIEYALVPPNVAMVIQALNIFNMIWSENKRDALEREQK